MGVGDVYPFAIMFVFKFSASAKSANAWVGTNTSFSSEGRALFMNRDALMFWLYPARDRGDFDARVRENEGREGRWVFLPYDLVCFIEYIYIKIIMNIL